MTLFIQFLFNPSIRRYFEIFEGNSRNDNGNNDSKYEYRKFRGGYTQQKVGPFTYHNTIPWNM